MNTLSERNSYPWLPAAFRSTQFNWASSSVQCSLKASSAATPSVGAVVVSVDWARSSRLALPGVSSSVCRNSKSTKAFQGGSWLACRLNRPMDASSTTWATVRFKASEVSSSGASGASGEMSEGFWTRRMMSSPALTLSWLASARLRVTSSSPG